MAVVTDPDASGTQYLHRYLHLSTVRDLDKQRIAQGAPSENSRRHTRAGWRNRRTCTSRSAHCGRTAATGRRSTRAVPPTTGSELGDSNHGRRYRRKGIGLAAKDIVIGIAAAAVGAAGGGQAGASGVLKAGDGIDKIVAMTTGGESRAQRFDRGDYAAAAAGQSAASGRRRRCPRIASRPHAPEQGRLDARTNEQDSRRSSAVPDDPDRPAPSCRPARRAGAGQRGGVGKGAPVALTSGEAISPSLPPPCLSLRGDGWPRTKPHRGPDRGSKTRRSNE